MDGHPQGAEWFCTKHDAAARKLSNLGLEDAMQRLMKKMVLLVILGEVNGQTASTSLQ